MQKNLSFMEILLEKTESPSFSLNLPKFGRQLLLLKKAVIDVVSFPEKSKNKKSKISNCLRLSSLLINRLFKFMPEDGPHRQTTGKVISELKGFIFFLEKQSGRWFDYDCFTPVPMQLDLKKEINNTKEDIRKGLKKLNIDPPLKEVVLEPLERFINNKCVRLYRFFYLRKFISWINEFINRGPVFSDPEWLLIKLLIDKNLNSGYFHDFLISYIDQTINECASISQELQKLLDFQICLADLMPDKNLCYCKNKPSVFDFFKAAIKARISYCKQKQDSSSTLEEQSVVPFRKIKTTLKVGELAVFSRLLIDEKLVVDTNCSEVVNLTANLFSSEYAAEISPASLRNRYYSFDRKSLQEVKKILISLTQKVDMYS